MRWGGGSEVGGLWGSVGVVRWGDCGAVLGGGLWGEYWGSEVGWWGSEVGWWGSEVGWWGSEVG